MTKEYCFLNVHCEIGVQCNLLPPLRCLTLQPGVMSHFEILDQDLQYLLHPFFLDQRVSSLDLRRESVLPLILDQQKYVIQHRQVVQVTCAGLDLILETHQHR